MAVTTLWDHIAARSLGALVVLIAVLCLLLCRCFETFRQGRWRRNGMREEEDDIEWNHAGMSMGSSC